MTQTWYKIYFDGFTGYARGVQTNPSAINNRTRGETATFDLSVPGSIGDLFVPSGETYVVASGTVEVFNDVTVAGTLTVEGTLVVTGTLNSTSGTVNVTTGTIDNLSEKVLTKLLDHDRHAGSYTLNDTLDNVQRYKERLPSNPNINSLVVGLEPSGDLSNRNIAGKWGLISNITDSRTRALTNPVVTLEMDILADISEYADVTAVQNDLKI